MNCEHDKTIFLTFNFGGKQYTNNRDEMLKRGYVAKQIFDSKEEENKLLTYLKLSTSMDYVHANYYLFAVSNKRTIALINPFYRLYDDSSFLSITNKVPDVWPTLLSRETMRCNTQTYQHFGETNDNDLFHYGIKDISAEEVIIINNMMLDRAYYWIGFDDSSRIVRSLNVYSMIDKKFQRNDYDNLIKYLYSLGYDFPRLNKYALIKDKLTNQKFTKEEMDYVEFFYNLIQHN